MLAIIEMIPFLISHGVSHKKALPLSDLHGNLLQGKRHAFAVANHAGTVAMSHMLLAASLLLDGYLCCKSRMVGFGELK